MTNYTLSNVNIDYISEAIGEFLDQFKIDRKDALRIKLAAEEILLNYQEQFGEEQVVSMDCRKRFGRIRIVLTIAADRYNPFYEKRENEEASDVLHRILVNMGLAPNWEYVDGINRITFIPRKKERSPLEALFVAILAAFVCGAFCLLLPEDIRIAMITYFVGPINKTFTGLLSAISGPLIFLSVTWGMYSIGDVATLNTIGKKMLSRFTTMSLFTTFIAGFAILPFFEVAWSSSTSFNLYNLYEMVLNIIPSNFFTPFVNNNPLQIIFISIAIGLSLLVLGNKTKLVAKFVEEANYTINLIMEAVSKFLSIFIFGSFFEMIISHNSAILVQIYKIVMVCVFATTVILAVYLGIVCLRRKVSPILFWKKILPTFMVGFTTSSSVAALQINMETCEKKLGIDKRIVNFGVPLGQTIFKATDPLIYFGGAMCMAEAFSVPMSPLWLATAIFISIILAVATPPIPGGGLTCYTLLCLQLNIPIEALSIIIAGNVFLDGPTTGINLATLQLELTELAADLGMLDYDKLRKPM